MLTASNQFSISSSPSFNVLLYHAAPMTMLLLFCLRNNPQEQQ
jgi:hypothetical protein